MEFEVREETHIYGHRNIKVTPSAPGGNGTQKNRCAAAVA